MGRVLWRPYLYCTVVLSIVLLLFHPVLLNKVSVLLSVLLPRAESHIWCRDRLGSSNIHHSLSLSLPFVKYRVDSSISVMSVEVADASTMSTMNVSAVSVKLPPFWCENPRLWFAQAESQFATRAVTVSLTKYHYVVSSLTQEAAARVMNLVESVPPGSDPYGVLKEALLSTFSLSEYQRAEAIANLPPLSDRKPSQLLAQLKILLPPNHPECFLVRHAFLSRLPEHVRTSVIKEKGSLDEIALLADTLMAATSASHLSEISPPSVVQEVFLDAVTRGPPPQRRSRDRQLVPLPSMCWYHRQFGDKATRCRHSRDQLCSAASTSGNGRTGGRN